MKKIITLLVVVSVYFNSNAQQTFVPDDNFEQALIDLGYDSGALDNYVPTANIVNVVNLNIHNKAIANLTGIEDFTNLEILNCSSNHLTLLNLTSNTSLRYLKCRINNLTTLNVSSNPLLHFLSCSNNNLTELNLSSTTNLGYLYCHNNNLTDLDLSTNSALVYLMCFSNNLTKLNVKNTNISIINTMQNPNLSCIEVDDVNFSTTNWVFYIDSTTSFSEGCPDLTYVPDDNFEQYLIDQGYDSGPLDDFVPTANIENETLLNVENRNISDLTGIKGFSSLLFLLCNDNQLTELDLSKNEKLWIVYCQNNNLEQLKLRNILLSDFIQLNATNNPNLHCIEVDDENYWNNIIDTILDDQSHFTETECSSSNNVTYVPDDNFELYIETTFGLGNDTYNNNFVDTAIIELVTNLYVSSQNIDDLTGIEGFSNLAVLNCGYNNLSTLDLSNNLNLTNINCFFNNITSLQLNENSPITFLNCQYNQLETLNVNALTQLNTLFCTNNQISNLDVSENPNLGILYCQYNQITSLDLRENINLESFRCNGNQLTYLNLKSGNNTNLVSSLFNIRYNPNLLCVEVDDENYSTTNWVQKDNQTYYSENCHYNETYIPDNNFEQKLINLGFDNVLDDYVLTANIENVISLDLVNNNISDLTGIEDFTNLENLYCRRNNLTTLDLSQNLALRLLRCQTNRLTNLDLSNNVNLTELRCNRNNLTSLNVSNNINLNLLYCQKNRLVNLNISNNTHLQTFSAYSNNLEQLIINNTSNSSNSIYNITQFEIRKNKNLYCVEVNDASWSTENWTNKDAHTYYYEGSCSYPNIPSTKIVKIDKELLISEELIVYNLNDTTIQIKTKNSSKINQLKIYDVLGKLVVEVSPNKSEVSIPTTINKGSILFLKAQLENGSLLNSKFIKR